MKKTIAWMACLLGIILISSCSKDEDVMTGTISGFVSEYANANTPIAGASITLNGKGITKVTGSDGRFEFTDLEPGTYTIAASANTYQSTTKQVTVYAGQTINCDFQLAKASSNVEISPLTLAFGTDNDQLTFTITNRNSSALQYSISGYPSYLTVTPSSATVAGNGGKQTVTVKVNRNEIDKDVSTSLTVNVGSDSYSVAVSIGYKEQTEKISLSETTLDFGQQYTELQFAIKNIGNSGDVSWTIDAPTVNCVKVNPAQGVTAMGKESQVTVSIDRDKMTEDNLQTFITVRAAGGSKSVQIFASRYQGGGNQGGNGGGQTGDNVVKNALYAYYTFNGETTDLTENGIVAALTKTSYVDSYNGTKALKIPTDGTLTIAEGLMDQKTSSICFWTKDLYDGHVFSVKSTAQYDIGFVLSVVNGKLKFILNDYNSCYKYNDMPAFDNQTLEGWHHVAIINNNGTKILYVDGIKTDQLVESNSIYQCGIKFTMGGSLDRPNINATTIIIDNMRVYKYRAITADDVKEIYQYEK